jgi:hypothetical protein
MGPRSASRTRGQRRRTPPLGKANRQATHSQQVQATNQGQGIDVQGTLATSLCTVVGWGRDRCLIFNRDRHHKLLSITSDFTSFLTSLSYSVKFGNALREHKEERWESFPEHFPFLHYRTKPAFVMDSCAFSDIM